MASYGGMYNYGIELSKGYIPNHLVVNKFGHAPDGIQTTATDLWVRADATPTQQIWLAPTAARVHAIVSTSTDDDGDPVGDGARTLRVWGVPDWDTIEVSEDIILNGTTPVNTVGSYVTINRMKVLSSGATSINVGAITATAAVDGTVTAAILASRGQTEQAIFGFSSQQTAYLSSFELSMNDNTASSRMDFSLIVNEFPQLQPTVFIAKYRCHLINSGNSFIKKSFDNYFKIDGPAIIKMQGISNNNDADCSGGFDLVLVTP